MIANQGRWWTTAIAAIFGAVLAVSTTTAAPTPGATAAAPASPCTFKSSPDPRSLVVPSCVAVSVAMERLPAVGEQATVRIQMRAKIPLGNARLKVRVSDTLRLDTTGSGLGAPRAVGLEQHSDVVLPLSTSDRTVTVRVTAVAPGPAQVQADVTDAAAPAPDRAGHGSTEFTVGTARGTSKAGISSPDTTARRGNPHAGHNGGPTGGGHGGVALAPAGQICANGTFTFTNQAGNWLLGRNLTVKVWGRTTQFANPVNYVSGLTDNNGYYNLCFTAPVQQMYLIWVEFRSESSVWQVTDGNNAVYSVNTAAQYWINSGSDVAFGATSPAAAAMRAWHVFDTINLAYWWRNSSTTCWTPVNPPCNKITYKWWAGNQNGGWYQPGANAANSWVQLRDNDPDSEHLVLHETGHALMHVNYNYWWPPNLNCFGHNIWLDSGVGCAWTEGFANAVAGNIKGDNLFVWPDGSSVNLMNTTWFNSNFAAGSNNWQNGDGVEGRVAGALIDLWNRVDGGKNNTLNLMRQNTSSSFWEYFSDDRPTTGMSITCPTRDIVYDHTIQYPPVNCGFEKQYSGWTTTGGNVIGNWGTYAARSGTYYSWLGGYGYANTSTIAQTVTLPNTTTVPWLSYYTRIVTWETENVAYDTLRLQVTDGGVTTTLLTLSNTDASAGYVIRWVYLGAYRGHTVTLKWVGTEDTSLRTDFVIDDTDITYWNP